MRYTIIIGLIATLSAFVVEAENESKLSPAEVKQAELLAQATLPADDATNIKVIVQKKQTIEEYRQRGELVLVKVIPNDGVPYFIDPLERNKNRTSGRELIDAGVTPVHWVIKEF